MIDLPDQPRAERVLRASLARENPPQQLLFSGPPGTGKREAALRMAWALAAPGAPFRPWAGHVDVTVVAPTGNVIRLEELEPALEDVSRLPLVGPRRVIVIDGAERLREEDGAHRILKTLEEPPSRSHLILVTDRPAELLPTIRSRCLPVPFRTPGWRTVAERLTARGLAADDAEGLARGAGTAALRADDFSLSMRLAGATLGTRLLAGPVPATRVVAEIQREMEAAAQGRSSPDVERLRAEAAALAGKRGERTAVRRAEEQERREVRRALTDGWLHVLDGAAEVLADALAISVGAPDAVRHRARMTALRAPLEALDGGTLERMAEEIAQTRAEMELNPTVDAAVQAMIIRAGALRAGRGGRLRPAGQLVV